MITRSTLEPQLPSPLFKAEIFEYHVAPNEIQALNRFIQTARTGDPALFIQFSPEGLADREAAGAGPDCRLQIVKFLVEHGLAQEAGSDSIYYHGSQAHVFRVLRELLQEFPWCRHLDGHPDVAYAYVMLTERRKPDTTPLAFVFNQF
jgi:hypothetical protein